MIRGVPITVTNILVGTFAYYHTIIRGVITTVAIFLSCELTSWVRLLAIILVGLSKLIVLWREGHVLWLFNHQLEQTWQKKCPHNSDNGLYNISWHSRKFLLQIYSHWDHGIFLLCSQLWWLLLGCQPTWIKWLHWTNLHWSATCGCRSLSLTLTSNW